MAKPTELVLWLAKNLIRTTSLRIRKGATCSSRLALPKALDLYFMTHSPPCYHAVANGPSLQIVRAMALSDFLVGIATISGVIETMSMSVWNQ